MGKERLYRVGGGRSGGGSSRSSTKRGRIAEKMKEAASTSTGCMCGVFHLFDFHPPDKYPFLQEEATTSKGIEAPRNSLGLEEAAALKEEEENLNFPVGIQIKTGHGKISRLDDFSSEYSPGTKSPSVVARLMGLDLLPESNSPSISSSSSSSFQRKDRNLLLRSRSSRSLYEGDVIGARSLPETPRISSARRSDVEYHRLSLQINKSETTNAEMLVATRGRRFRDENTTSRGHCSAKQIVEHVKDRLSTRRVVGVDITNTINRNRSEHHNRDENLILLKPTKKNPKISSRIASEISKQSNKPTTNSVTKNPRSVSLSHQVQGITNPLKPKCRPIIPSQEHQHHKDCKKKIVGGSGNCSSSRLRNKKEEPFVHSTATDKFNLRDKKSKRTPLSSDILKKSPPPSPTKLPQKQVSDALSSKIRTQLSRNPSQSYKQPHLQPDKIFTSPESILPRSTNGCATALPGGAAAEYGNYIQRILECAGIINKVNSLCLAKWHVSSHPIDPSIFHHLELFHPTTTNSAACNTILSHRCNRKLIFQLVDEILADILTPNFNLNHPWISPMIEDCHFPLVDELCKKIDGFPAAKCLVLEDIDSLIDDDLLKSRLIGSFNEEESIVCEIEGEIVEWLLRETVAVMGGHAAAEKTETDRYHVRLSRDEMPLFI